MKAWEEVIKRLDRIIEILERMARGRGVISAEQERRVLDYLRKHGRMTKKEVKVLLGISERASLDLMKKLDSLEEVVYIPGRGLRQSELIHVDGDSTEAKGLRILKFMPRGSSFGIDQLADTLDMSRDEVIAAVRAAQRMFPDEIAMREGVVIRFR